MRASPQADESPPGLRVHWAWSAWTLLATAGIFRLAQNASLTTFPLLGAHTLHLGPATVGLLGTVIGLAGVLATLLMGAVVPTDRTPLVIAVGTVLLVLSGIAFAAAGSLLAFVPACVLLGVAGGIGPPSLATEAARGDPLRMERALARYTMVLSAGLALGPLLETAVLDLSGQNLRMPFWFGAALSAIGLALGLRLHRHAVVERPPMVRPSPWSLLRPQGGLTESVDGRIALIVQLLYAVPFAAVTVFGALVAHKDYGLSPSQALLAFSAFFVASMLGRMLLTLQAPIQAKSGLLLGAAGCTVIGMTMLSLGSAPAVLFGAMVILGVAHGITFPLALALTAQAVGRERLAAANASLFAATNLATVVAPVILGAVAAASGYRVMEAVVLIPVAAATIVLLAQLRQRRRADLLQPATASRILDAPDRQTSEETSG